LFLVALPVPTLRKIFKSTRNFLVMAAGNLIRFPVYPVSFYFCLQVHPGLTLPSSLVAGPVHKMRQAMFFVFLCCRQAVINKLLL
jgi:hypothetical protein